MGGTNSKLEEALIKDFPPTEKLTGFVNVKKNWTHKHTHNLIYIGHFFF